MSGFMPRVGERFVDGNGMITRPWQDWLRSLSNAGSLAEVWSAIGDIRRQLADHGAGSFLPSTTTVQGIDSVTSYGSLADGRVQLLLVGDEVSPAASHYYGTDETGVRGFFERLLATLADVDADSPSVGDGLVWNGSAWAAQPVASTGGYLPLTTGEIAGDQPVFVYGPDGRLIYAPVN